MSARNLNDPSNWLAWLKACQKDGPSNPIRLPPPPPGSKRPQSIFGALTGQDSRALFAIATCWHLYACSDMDGRTSAISAIRSLLAAVQPHCRVFARELIAQSLDWSDRDRLWPMVCPLAQPAKALLELERDRLS